MTAPDSVPLLTHARDLLPRYDVLLCDVWGVLHDGRNAYPSANNALPRYRAQGGTVVLVSNAPMPSDVVAKVCLEKGVLRDCWDGIVSSGDIALNHIADKGYTRTFGIGMAGRDDSFFDRLPGQVTKLADADVIACTGLIHERTETAETYLPILRQAYQLKLPFVCANPDLAVHMGHELLPCAGAIAALYEDMGGDVFWAGKPHPSAYAAGLKMAERLRGAPVAQNRVLSIGDAVRTDVASAKGAGVDALFVAQGLHRDEIMKDGRVDIETARQVLSNANMPAVAVMSGLDW